MSPFRSARWFALPLLAWASAGGCGDLRERAVSSPAERTAIDSLVGQMVAAQGLLDRPGDGVGLVAVMRIDAVAALLAPADGATPWRAAPTAAGELDGCAVASPDGALFTACEIGGHTLDGNVSRTAGWVRTELSDVFVTDEGREGAVTLQGSLLRRRGSPATLSGSLEIYAVWTAADGSEGLLDATLSCERLALSETGCAVGGTMQVAGSFGERLSYAPVSRTISFGPECGDVAITP